MPDHLPPDALHVFLLMGQSNMAGRGDLCETDTECVEGVWVMDGQCLVDDRSPTSPMRWRPGAHPLHLNEPQKAQFGLGLDFARAYQAARPGTSVGLIPAAWGGQPIAKLGPGTPLFDNTIARARVAARDGKIVGVLWHQGEGDAETEVRARDHAPALSRLVHELRHQLDDPAISFAIGDLADACGAKGDSDRQQRVKTVRAGLRAVADDLPGAAWVSSAGLEAQPDQVHFTREALREFGRRYASALVGLASTA